MDGHAPFQLHQRTGTFLELVGFVARRHKTHRVRQCYLVDYQQPYQEPWRTAQSRNTQDSTQTFHAKGVSVIFQSSRIPSVNQADSRMLHGVGRRTFLYVENGQERKHCPEHRPTSFCRRRRTARRISEPLQLTIQECNRSYQDCDGTIGKRQRIDKKRNCTGNSTARQREVINVANRT